MLDTRVFGLRSWRYEKYIHYPTANIDEMNQMNVSIDVYADFQAGVNSTTKAQLSVAETTRKIHAHAQKGTLYSSARRNAGYNIVKTRLLLSQGKLGKSIYGYVCVCSYNCVWAYKYL